MLSNRKGNPEAIIMVGSYKPCAEFIKLARQIKLDALFVNISFVGSIALARELGPSGAGVIIMQVVPFPKDVSIPLVARYQAAMQALEPGSAPAFGSLEGYIVGRLVILALDKLSGEPTRQALLDVILKSSFDLGGATLVYGPDDNQGMDDVFLTVIQPDGTLKAISTLTQLGG